MKSRVESAEAIRGGGAYRGNKKRDLLTLSWVRNASFQVQPRGFQDQTDSFGFVEWSQRHRAPIGSPRWAEGALISGWGWWGLNELVRVVGGVSSNQGWRSNWSGTVRGAE